MKKLQDLREAQINMAEMSQVKGGGPQTDTACDFEAECTDCCASGDDYLAMTLEDGTRWESITCYP